MRLEYKVFPFEPTLVDVGGDPGHFSGKASVYGVVDRGNDKVMPGAFTKSLAESGFVVPVLNAHDPKDSIGLATLEDSDTALLVKDAKLELELQSARDTHIRLKSGIVKGLSIGYQTQKARQNKGVRELHEVKLWEVSVVTFPMLTLANVTGVKSDRLEDLAAIVGENEAARLAIEAKTDDVRVQLDQIYHAVSVAYGQSLGGAPYIQKVSDEGWLIACRGGNYWQIPYEFVGDEVKLGAPVPVEMSWAPKVSASADLKSLNDFLLSLKSLPRN